MFRENLVFFEKKFTFFRISFAGKKYENFRLFCKILLQSVLRKNAKISRNKKCENFAKNQCAIFVKYFCRKFVFAKFCFVFAFYASFICLRNRNENYVSFAANSSPVKKHGFCKSDACVHLKYFKPFNLIEILVHQRYSASGCKDKGIIKVEFVRRTQFHSFIFVSIISLSII